MTNPPETQNAAQPELDEAEPGDAFQRLDALLNACLNYARTARLQGFRYCRRRSQSSVRPENLETKLQALETELARLASQRTCQTAALTLLVDLYQLGNGNNPQAKQLARKIDNALLALR